MSESAATSNAVTLGARIRLIRGQLSQKARADVLGVAVSSYQHYERGERSPDAAFLARLGAEGWNVHWLVTGDGHQRFDTVSSAGADASQAMSLDRETLARSMRVLELALELARVEVGPTTKAMMVADVYQHLLSHGFDGDRLFVVTQDLKRRLQDIQAGRNAGTGETDSGPTGPSTEN